jgi:hypothetical protein
MLGLEKRRRVKIPRKSYTIEKIISKLREAKVLLSQDQSVGDICRSFNISEQT